MADVESDEVEARAAKLVTNALWTFPIPNRWKRWWILPSRNSLCCKLCVNNMRVSSAMHRRFLVDGVGW